MMHSDVKYGQTVVSRNIDDPSRGTVVIGLGRKNENPDIDMLIARGDLFVVDWGGFVSVHEPKDLCEAPKIDLAPMERDSIMLAIEVLRASHIDYPRGCRAADALEAML